MLPSRGGVEDGCCCCIISPLVEGSSSDLARRFRPQFRGKNRRDIGKSQLTWTRFQDGNARLTAAQAQRPRPVRDSWRRHGGAAFSATDRVAVAGPGEACSAVAAACTAR